MIWSAKVDYQCENCLRQPSGNDIYNKPDCHFACIGDWTSEVNQPNPNNSDWMLYPDGIRKVAGGLRKLEHKFTCEYCGHFNHDILVLAGPHNEKPGPISLVLKFGVRTPSSIG